MDGDAAVREHIDASFGEGPAALPVDDLLARGHRALTRRRLLTAVSAAAAVAVVLGGGAALAGDGGSDDARDPGFATSATPPSDTPSPSLSAGPPSRAEITAALRRPLSEYDNDGRVVIDPAADVLTRIDDPYAGGTIDHSVALELSFRGATYWIAEYHVRDGSSGGTGDYAGNQSQQTFEQWVQAQDPGADVGSTVGADVWPGTVEADLVHFSQDGSDRLVANRGARIVEQRRPVSVGESFAGPGDRTAAAEVVSADGAHVFVLARAFDGKPGQYIYVSKQEGGKDLADFLDLARHRYATGGGGLL